MIEIFLYWCLFVGTVGMRTMRLPACPDFWPDFIRVTSLMAWVMAGTMLLTMLNLIADPYRHFWWIVLLGGIAFVAGIAHYYAYRVIARLRTLELRCGGYAYCWCNVRRRK